MMKNDETLSLAVPEHLHKGVREYSQKEHRSKSSVIRQALYEFLMEKGEIQDG